MRLYEVRYWSEAPGGSGGETVLVLAKDKKDAIQTTIKKQAVYKADQPHVTAKLRKSESMVIGYVNLKGIRR